MNRQVHVLLAAIAALCLAPTTSIAAQVPLTESSVIGGSGSQNGEGNPGDFLWDTATSPTDGTFNALNVTDGDLRETEGHFWLDNTDAGFGEPGYFVIDLGDTYNIDQIDLYNTHNRHANNFSSTMISTWTFQVP